MTFLVVWTWVKKHWQIVLGALGVALGFFFGFETKKTPVIVTGVDPVKTKVENQTAAAVAVAQQQHDVVVQQDQAQAAAADAAVVTQEQTKTTTIESGSDPTDATNEYLQSVSKEIGGGKG